MLDALLVAKIDQYFFENTDRRLGIGGNVQPRLCHQCKQTNCFQGNGLSSRVGTSDDQILEEGTHDELLALSGKYAELFEVQSKYYREGGNGDEE